MTIGILALRFERRKPRVLRVGALCTGYQALRDNTGPMVEVCAVAKRDFEGRKVLNDYGMYVTYGEAVNTEEMSRQRYLPEGLVEGCKLTRDIKKDVVLTYSDVGPPTNRWADHLWAEQYRHFKGETWLDELVKGSVEQLRTCRQANSECVITDFSKTVLILGERPRNWRVTVVDTAMGRNIGERLFQTSSQR
jgi:hypothetical protein